MLTRFNFLSFSGKHLPVFQLIFKPGWNTRNYYLANVSMYVYMKYTVTPPVQCDVHHHHVPCMVLHCEVRTMIVQPLPT